MISSQLGRLEKVDARDIWESEWKDFTPWLAQKENLCLLAETIGIELECEGREKEVGPFRADILCKDIATDSWVLIENQLEPTDHVHLGQLLTYAAGLDAVTIVWVAERFREEHRAALDWLNKRTDENINFFGLEVELWRIGNSPVAPKFNIVCKPNDWARTVKEAASGELSENQQMQLDFWTAFREYMEKNSSIRCQKPAPHSWMVHSIGRTGCHLASIASTWNSVTNSDGRELRVELVFGDENSKEYYAVFEKRRAQVDKEIGLPLIWLNQEGAKKCRVYTRRDADFGDRKLWPEQHDWLKRTLESFHKVFVPIVKTLDSELESVP